MARPHRHRQATYLLRERGMDDWCRCGARRPRWSVYYGKRSQRGWIEPRPALTPEDVARERKWLMDRLG